MRRLRSPGLLLIAIGFLVVGGLVTASLRSGTSLTGQAILTNPGVAIDSDASSISLDCSDPNHCVIGYLKKSGNEYHGSLAFCDSNTCQNPTKMHGSRIMPGDTQTKVMCSDAYNCRMLLHSPTGRTIIYWCANQDCTTYTETEVPFGASVPKADMDCSSMYPCFVTGTVNNRLKLFRCSSGGCTPINVPVIGEMTLSEPTIACPFTDSCYLSFKPSGNNVINYMHCRNYGCESVEYAAVEDGEFNGLAGRGYGIIECKGERDCSILSANVSMRLLCDATLCSSAIRQNIVGHNGSLGTRQVYDCSGTYCGFYTSNKLLYRCTQNEGCTIASASPLPIASTADFGFSNDYIGYVSDQQLLLYRFTEGPVCGDGKREGNEQCDDGNLKSGDGCSDICRTDSASSAGSCTGVCPDGSTYPKCNVDGSPIRYFVDPCKDRTGSAGSQTSAPVSPSVCGDGKCGGAETCSTCAQDCGNCANNCVEVPISNFGNTFTYPTDSPACNTFEACYTSCQATSAGCTCTGFKCGSQLCGYAPEREGDQPVCGPMCVTSSAGAASSGCGQSIILCAEGIQQICVNGQWKCAVSSASSRRSSAGAASSDCGPSMILCAQGVQQICVNGQWICAVSSASSRVSAAASQAALSSAPEVSSAPLASSSSRRSRASSAVASLVPVCGQIGAVCTEDAQCCSTICRAGNCAPPVIGGQSSAMAESSEPLSQEASEPTTFSSANPVALSPVSSAGSSRRATSRGLVLLIPSSESTERANESSRPPSAAMTASSAHSIPSMSPCGDGIIQAREVCDLGSQNTNAPDGLCRPDCTLGRCSDGIRDSQEECDDGNRISGDGCDTRCMREIPQGTLPAEVVNLPLTISFDGTPDAQHAAGTQQPAASPYLQGSWLPGQALPQQQEVLPEGIYSPGQLSAFPSQTASVVYEQSDAPGTAQSGPGALAMMAAGSAAGYAWIRRRRTQ